MQAWLWAPASPSAPHPLGCSSSASTLWGQKYKSNVSLLLVVGLPREYRDATRHIICQHGSLARFPHTLPGGGSAGKYIPPEIKEHKRPSANPTQLHI